MNKGTILRTVARIAFSIYTAFCMWQVSIGELSKLLDAAWLIPLCAAVIVVCGLIVDGITTWYNNDYNDISAKYTAQMRQEKREQDPNYKGERFFTDDIEPEYEVEEDEADEQ